MTSLPPEQHASYSAIIDKILASSDLTTISAKRIRKGLQEQVPYDITPQKAAITDLIMERFDKFQRDHENSDTIPEPPPTTNGAVAHAQPKEEPTTDPSEPTSPTKRKARADDEDEDELSDVVDSSPPPPKKAKKTKGAAVETDEELAKRMQAELNAPSARSTRRGGTTTKKKTTVAKKEKKPKKKSKAKIGSDLDSEVDGSSGEKPEREKKGGFHKPMVLSEPLSALLNESALSRPQTVKQIWAYVKARDLQDPSDKRQIRCDDAMRAVFKQDRVHMFTMNKLLAGHLYAVDE